MRVLQSEKEEIVREGMLERAAGENKLINQYVHVCGFDLFEFQLYFTWRES